MPKGKENASRTGSNIKPNTNAEDSIDSAAEVTVHPDEQDEIVIAGDEAHRAAQAPENKAATEREDSKQD